MQTDVLVLCEQPLNKIFKITSLVIFSKILFSNDFTLKNTTDIENSTENISTNQYELPPVAACEKAFALEACDDT